MAARRYSGRFPTYVPAAARQQEAAREVAALRKKGRVITPVRIEGKNLTTTFWGKAWCDNLESYSDYASRLPRGRSYVRSGAIVHLEIGSGRIHALVRGTSMYTIDLTVKPLSEPRWHAVVEACSAEIGSLVELLQGRLSQGVMQIVTDKTRGIFPSPREIELSCSCPDWATMCKHVAAAMYGVGARLDHEPELLFRLRGVDPGELVARSIGRTASRARAPKKGARAGARTIAEKDLGAIFGIDLEDD